VSNKRKTLSARAREAFERARGPHLLDLLPRPDYTNERRREVTANAVLTLRDQSIDGPLHAAFKKFSWDPRNPHHWRRLLETLALIHFEVRPPRVRGARPKLDEHRRLLFQTHLAMARKRLRGIMAEHGHAGDPSHELLADYFRYKWPDRYGSISAETLRKYIATSPPAGRRPKGGK
jgi:hypothetical protein